MARKPGKVYRRIVIRNRIASYITRFKAPRKKKDM